MFFCLEKFNSVTLAMAATKTRISSFSRNISAVSAPQLPGIKCGPNGTFFVSSGIPDLDSNLSTLLFSSFLHLLEAEFC